MEIPNVSQDTFWSTSALKEFRHPDVYAKRLLQSTQTNAISLYRAGTYFSNHLIFHSGSLLRFPICIIFTCQYGDHTACPPERGRWICIQVLVVNVETISGAGEGGGGGHVQRHDVYVYTQKGMWYAKYNVNIVKDFSSWTLHMLVTDVTVYLLRSMLLHTFKLVHLQTKTSWNEIKTNIGNIWKHRKII